MEKKDHYEILQVSPNAEPEVIAAAYRRLARKYHPDVNKSPEAGKRMKEINAAYDVLRDPAKRASYDRLRERMSAQPRYRREAPPEPERRRLPKKALIIPIALLIILWVYANGASITEHFTATPQPTLTLPLSEYEAELSDKAKSIAFSVLGGAIVEVVPYRDRDNPHQLMAVMRKPSDRDEFSHRIFILEQFGSAWRVVWESEELFGTPDLRVFKVHDVDRDGVGEISFGIVFGGSGIGETVYLYVPSDKRTYWVSIVLTSSIPLANKIETMEPESPADQLYLDALESICDKAGLVGPPPEIDLDDPQYAVLRWHKENGELLHGQVEIHLYEGPRECGGSIAAQAEDNHYVWTSCFKDAVYGYMKSEDKHFVVWSGGTYGWAPSLLVTDRYLWIGTRFDGLLRFDKEKYFLWQFKTIFGKELTDIHSLELDEGYLVIEHSWPEIHIEHVEMELLEEETPSGVD